MIIDVLTLFPEMFEGIKNSSIIKRAIEKNIVTINIHDFRDFSTKNNRRVDDYSYGGGAGMVIEALPIIKCLKTIDNYKNIKKIITSPSGNTYNQKKAEELSKEENLIIVCGHYEGIDERINKYIDEEVSIGDYILTGGEIAALTIIDSVTRLLKGTLGNDESIVDESFTTGILEYPQYTRPENLEGEKVPSILISGDHEKVRKWRRFKALEKTYHKRPELLNEVELNKEDQTFLSKIKNGEDFS